MTETVLLTGASGYIGLHCAKELIEAGYAVRGTVRSQAKAQEVRERLLQSPLIPPICLLSS